VDLPLATVTEASASKLDNNDGVVPTPALPVGIPQFAAAGPKIACGLKPDLDGLDWLKANGFQTVVHVRAAGEDDSADRRQIEKRGMKYVAIDCSTATPSRPLVDEFSRTVTDRANQPIFVYDRNGSLTGGLWYQHYRLTERLADGDARVRAVRLGLQ
jgi:protein tyrosine phosphatase (PTP) superfamily phosphohydrolase (DUF442 family)